MLNNFVVIIWYSQFGARTHFIVAFVYLTCLQIGEVCASGGMLPVSLDDPTVANELVNILFLNKF